MFSSIYVSGNDATSFLQGQLTQDLETVNARHSPLAAWCTPRGRVIAVLRLLARDDGYELVLPAELAASVMDGLARYRLRARVEIAACSSDWQARAVANEADLAMLQSEGLLPDKEAGSSRHAGDVTAVSLDDERHTVELYGKSAHLALQMPLSDEHWLEARIRAGIADITLPTSDRYTPHMLNLDRLQAISFNKGCYAGQEIVARTQHLGNAKRRIAPFTTETGIAAGSKADLDGTAVGDVVASAGQTALVLLPLDLHDRNLAVGGTSLAPLDR